MPGFVSLFLGEKKVHASSRTPSWRSDSDVYVLREYMAILFLDGRLPMMPHVSLSHAIFVKAGIFTLVFW
jgi:hypothetical protein